MATNWLGKAMLYEVLLFSQTVI